MKVTLLDRSPLSENTLLERCFLNRSSLMERSFFVEVILLESRINLKKVIYLHKVAIFRLVVKDVEPGVLVEGGVVVRRLHQRRHVQAVRQCL
jgi:hypothetical protein